MFIFTTILNAIIFCKLRKDRKVNYWHAIFIFGHYLGTFYFVNALLNYEPQGALIRAMRMEAPGFQL